MLLFTDGLVDMKNEEGEYFSEEMIEKYLDDNRNSGAQEFNLQLMQELEAFKGKGEYPDDIAILTCKMHSAK
jgi:sigma-B regulation protein RsbU (phosphoserine phosphatase)